MLWKAFAPTLSFHSFLGRALSRTSAALITVLVAASLPAAAITLTHNALYAPRPARRETIL